MAMKYWQRESLELTGIVIASLMTGLTVPISVGLVTGSFSDADIFRKFVFYYGMLFGGLFLIIALKVREILTSNFSTGKKRDVSPFSDVYLHDPEQDGLLMRLSPQIFGFLKNPFRLAALSFMIFTLVSMFGALSGTFFVAIPTIAEFAITPGEAVVFAAEPAATAETLFFIALASMQIAFFKWLFARLGMNQLFFWLFILLVIPALVGFEWMGYHVWRYGAEETKLIATFIFGAVGTLLVLVTGSYIPWYVWHVMNNVFVSLSAFISNNEQLAVTSILLLLMFAVLYGAIELMARRFSFKKINPDEIYTNG